MSDEQIVEYVKDMIVDNLAKKDFWEEIAYIKFDETNEVLLQHINGVIALFQKAKAILEKGDGKDE